MTSIVIVVHGGNDHVQLGHTVTVPATIDGGEGNDYLRGGSGADTIVDLHGNNRIYAGAGNDLVWAGEGNDKLQGGAGNDILRGGAGNDLIVGGDGRDLLIGGFGADRLVGSAADDILIAGTTDHDGNEAALGDIMKEWTRTDADFAARVNHLRNGGGLNGSSWLNDLTVHDDGAVDVLTGSEGQDWFLFNRDGDVTDQATDMKTFEAMFAHDIDFITGPTAPC